MSTLRASASSAIYTASWRAIRALPEPVARAVFASGAEFAIRRDGPGVRRLRSNLSRVLGLDVDPARLEETVKQGVRSYARYWLEAFRLPTWSTERILDRMQVNNVDRLFQACARGSGVIGALHHSGNWDHAGAWACASGLPLTTVAERLKPESLYRRFLAYRERLGMEILPATGGAQAPLDVLTHRLQQGRVVVLLADRDLSRRAVDVSFFGGRTRMPAGPALLALRTGAPLMVISLWYDQAMLRADIGPPIPIPTTGDTRDRIGQTTQHMADGFAAGIAAHPQDWHMMQRLWPERATTGEASSAAITGVDDA